MSVSKFIRRVHNILNRIGNIGRIAALLMLPIVAHTQNQDSLAREAASFTAKKFAARRPLNITYQHFGSYNFSAKLYGQDLADADITRWSQFTVNANVNLLRNRHWLLQANGTYRFISTEASFSSPTGTQQRYARCYHYHTEGLSASYFSTLFGKMAIYTAGVSVDGSDESFERIRGQLSSSIVLKANNKTKMNVGLLLNIDPSTQFFLLPVFLYEHKFTPGVMADIILPRYLYVRKRMFTNGRLSAGWELDQTSFYLYNLDDRAKTYEFRQLDVNMGLVYEHLLPGSFIVTVKAGYRVNPTVRVFNKTNSFNDYIWEASTDPAPYVNVGLSFNPFVKRQG